MGLVGWIKYKLLLREKSNEGEMLKELRKEIISLKKENRELKEKIIVFPKRNNEEIPIKLFDENIEEVIIKNIREAKKEIYVAMAWFTSKTLMNELSSLKRRGINVKVMISDAEANDRNGNFNKLSAACNELKKIVIPKRENKKYNNLMHNKYCIIDNKKVIDGSYNWSNNAKYNLEHIIVIESKTVAKMYKYSFDKIYDDPQYYGFNICDALGQCYNKGF